MKVTITIRGINKKTFHCSIFGTKNIMANIPAPIKQEIVVIAGDTATLELSPVLDSAGAVVDLSGGTAELVIRETDFSGDIVDTFTDSTGLTLGATGIITLDMTAVETLAMRSTLTTGVWSLNVTLASVVRRTHEGVATLSDTTIQA